MPARMWQGANVGEFWVDFAELGELSMGSVDFFWVEAGAHVFVEKVEERADS